MGSMSHAPRPAVTIDRLLDDPSVIRSVVEDRAPYWPVQRYVANAAEYATLSGSTEPARMVVAPVFRGNWVLGGEVIEPDAHGEISNSFIRDVLHHPALVDGARRVFGAEIVRPDTVYANLTWQLPFAQGRGHTDIPAFRGFDRREHPVTFLTIMGLSGLFEQERVKVATAVAWFYAGDDGGFEYWPEGPDGPVVVHEGGITNTAIVGDNDFMWHRVRATGKPSDGMATLHLDTELRHGADGWAIVGDGQDPDLVLARPAWERLRLSLSWKALTFEDAADARRYDEGRDGLTLAGVVDRFVVDLAERGVDVTVPADPERDPEFIRTLTREYVRFPVPA